MTSLSLPAEHRSDLVLIHTNTGVLDNQLELVLPAGCVPRGTQQGGQTDRDPVMGSFRFRMLIDRPPGVADQVVKDLLKNQGWDRWDEIFRLIIKSNAWQ